MYFLYLLRTIKARLSLPDRIRVRATCPTAVTGILLLICGALASPPAFAVDANEELLPEHEAFAFEATLQPNNQIDIVWKIADGYYMYQDKFSFNIEGNAALANPVALPAGKQKFDELFGDVEVYFDQLATKIDVQPGADNAGFFLVAEGQGCNEPVGVCYPPIVHRIAFNTSTDGLSTGISSAEPSLTADGLIKFEGIDTSSLAITDRISQNLNVTPTPGITSTQNEEVNTEELDSVDELRDLLSAGFDQPDYLAVEDAFKLTLETADAQTLAARFDVAEGYYLYRKQIKFSSKGGAQIEQISLPEGEIKNDEFFGEAQVYRDTINFPIKLLREQENELLTLEVVYQGCADDGICYPPVVEKKQFSLPSFINTAEAQASSISNGIPESTALKTDQTGLPALLLGALLAGLLLTFTPCVLPLIPILSGVIAGQGEGITRLRGGLLAVIYVLGTAATYAAMGAIAGATGEQLQAYFQNIWAIGALALIFVIMALSMFGVFELQLPSSLQSRLQDRTRNLTGAFVPVFILGMVSALIVGACVSPILISFLGVAVSRADPVLGGQLMFVMALGMGIPLIALGFGAGYLIPRAGMWMETVKHVFGVMLIAVAIYMLGVLPAVPVLLLWGIFFIVLSVYFGAMQTLPENHSGWLALQKGVGLVLLVWGIIAMIGGFFGQRELLKPLPEGLFTARGVQGSGSPTENIFHATRIASLTEFDKQLVTAKSSGKKVVIDFYADWCVDCVKMEKTTFSDNRVTDTLKSDYLFLQVDLTDPADQNRSAIKKKLGVFGPPAVLFYDQNGRRQTEKDFYGYKDPSEFLSLITAG